MVTDEQLQRAIEAWMDKKFAQFGRWTARGLAIAAFGALCSLLFKHGFDYHDFFR